LQLIEENDQLSLLPKESKGTSQLIERLIYLQKEKLLNSKFEIKEKILEKLKVLTYEESNLPLPSDTRTEKLDRFKECLSKLVNNYNAFVKGSEIDIVEIKPKLVNQIREKFENFFKSFQKNHSKFFSDDFRKEIKDVILNTRGFKLANFTDQESFHILMKKEISLIASKAFNLILDCKEYTKDLLFELAKFSFSSYPKLQKVVLIEIKELIDKQTTTTKLLITELLEAEKEEEWTINPYYMDIIFKITSKIKEKKENNCLSFNIGSKSISSTDQIVKEEKYIELNDIKLSENDIFTTEILNSHSDEEMNILNIQISCFAYWKVFEKRFVDYCQLIILKKIVYFFRSELSLHLEKKFSPSSEEDDLITEDITINNKRKEIRRSLNNLEEALLELNKVI
jgi:hypothetical protein